MKNDLLANRHIGISEKDEAQMLHKIGVASLDELIDIGKQILSKLAEL